MKQSILFLVITFFYMTTNAQTRAKVLSKAHPVKSVVWGSCGVSFADSFWDMARTQLQKKFTKKIADSIENYSMSMNYPSGFKYLPKDSIKMYQVASFDNIFNGKFIGVRLVLMVPPAENKFLWEDDYSKRPNDFFLIFPKEAVVVEK